MNYEAKGEFDKALDKVRKELNKSLENCLAERREHIAASQQQSTSQQPSGYGSLVVNHDNMPGVYILDKDRMLSPVIDATVDNSPNLPPGKYTMGEDDLYSENFRLSSDGRCFLPSDRYTLKSDRHLYIKDLKDGYLPGEYQLCQGRNVFYLKSTELKRNPPVFQGIPPMFQTLTVYRRFHQKTSYQNKLNVNFIQYKLPIVSKRCEN
jgi:hypothetical protein